MIIENYLPYLTTWAGNGKFLSIHELYSSRLMMGHKYHICAYSPREIFSAFTFIKYMDVISINGLHAKISNLNELRALCLKFNLSDFI